MLFFRKKRHGMEQIERQNARAEGIKQDTIATIENTTNKTKKINRLLEANGIHLIIIKAMGGGGHGH